MNVAYLGPLKDYSGYGEANRHAVCALDAAGVKVMAQLVAYSHDSPNFGEIGQQVGRLLQNEDDYSIKILHTTPDQYRRHMESDKYHIGHFFWETDCVPEDFAAGLELMDEIWTGSQAGRAAILAAGVKTPIHVFPQALDTARPVPAKKYQLPGFDGFLFYSIFEWTDRKNPLALLETYYKNFQAGDKVGLLLKTYFVDFTLPRKRMIRGEIESLKRRLGLSSYPPVFLFLDLLDRDQMMRLHITGDCFVSAHRGEGWGVPQVEAALAGNPMISTSYGGCHEYFTDQQNAWLLPYKMVPVRGMEHSARWYTGAQNWAEVNREALGDAMVQAAGNPGRALRMGGRAKELVCQDFNFQAVGKLMAARLHEIEIKLGGENA